jgi:hypothetical protein
VPEWEEIVVRLPKSRAKGEFGGRFLGLHPSSG